jgi:hypothetical protein
LLSGFVPRFAWLAALALFSVLAVASLYLGLIGQVTIKLVVQLWSPPRPKEIKCSSEYATGGISPAVWSAGIRLMAARFWPGRFFMKRVFGLIGLLALLPCLMGASITCTTATANPNMQMQAIYEAGTFGTVQGEAGGSINGCAKIPGSLQYVWKSAYKSGTNNWYVTLTQMGVGEWDCWGTLNYFDMTGEPKSVNSEPLIRVTVAF